MSNPIGTFPANLTGLSETSNAPILTSNTGSNAMNPRLAACEWTANKGIAGGYPELDNNAQIPAQRFPAALSQGLFVPNTIIPWTQINDGASHPLSGVNAIGTLNTTGYTLSQWQQLLPAAVALSDELAWAALQSAINSLGQKAYGGTIYIPGGTYLVNKGLFQNYCNVRLFGSGRGNVHDTQTGGPIPCTLIKYNGSTAVTVLTVQPASNTSTGHINTNCDVTGLMIDGNSAALHGAIFASIGYTRIEVNAINTTDYAIVFDTTILAEHNDIQHNDISVAVANFGGGGGVSFQASGGTVSGSSNNGNFSMNRVIDLFCLVNTGVAVNISGTDNNLWDRVSIFKLGSGNAIYGTAAQAETFRYIGTNATPIIFDGATTIVRIDSLDTSNGTQPPSVTNGAIVEYNNNLTGLRSGFSSKNTQFYDSDLSRQQFGASGKVNTVASVQIINAGSDHLELWAPDGSKNLLLNFDGNGNGRLFTTTGGTLQLNNGGPVSIGGLLSLPGLPTSDPHVAGELYRNGQTLMVSLG